MSSTTPGPTSPAPDRPTTLSLISPPTVLRSTTGGRSRPGGRSLYVGGSAATLLRVLLVGPFIGRAGGQKIRLLAVRLGARHLAPLIELCQAGKVAIVIDRRYRLSDVPEALRYHGGGHAKGKVVITVA
jgi:NADPH:quinone reductase-like Zn-dependent oxidoreductase